jgi:hypothetical protein
MQDREFELWRRSSGTGARPEAQPGKRGRNWPAIFRAATSAVIFPLYPHRHAAAIMARPL